MNSYLCGSMDNPSKGPSKGMSTGSRMMLNDNVPGVGFNLGTHFRCGHFSLDVTAFNTLGCRIDSSVRGSLGSYCN